MHDREAYLMELLGFENRAMLEKFMAEPDRPTGNMRPPAVHELPDEGPLPNRQQTPSQK